MAHFLGTIAEFHNHIGPRIRNVANAIARKQRNACHGLCQHCQSRFTELDSAHIHGRGRRQIIEDILKDFINSNGEVNCDLKQVEHLIISAHQPIEKNFLFLCKPCHRKYDQHEENKPTKKHESNHNQNATNSQLHLLPILLHPENPAEFKQQLLKYKRATIKIHFSGGRTEEKIWIAELFSETSNVLGNLRSRPEYRSGAWQKRGIVRLDVSVECP